MELENECQISEKKTLNILWLNDKFYRKHSEISCFCLKEPRLYYSRLGQSHHTTADANACCVLYLQWMTLLDYRLHNQM